jgi:hypothetical protein
MNRCRQGGESKGPALKRAAATWAHARAAYASLTNVRRRNMVLRDGIAARMHARRLQPHTCAVARRNRGWHAPPLAPEICGFLARRTGTPRTRSRRCHALRSLPASSPPFHSLVPVQCRRGAAISHGCRSKRPALALLQSGSLRVRVSVNAGPLRD